ncbi:TIGR03084 family metal-binding protein [Streptomyces sp. NPDC059637]|uniref:TIGR03084 family metal-binding protein n=1 Tax=Streptomyces sp. NPDC059637 TaxID=3347752 RepID=UPI0036B4C9EF
MVDPEPVLDDLADETSALDGLVAGLDEQGWRTPTPAPGWTVAHQIAHLAWTDERALLAATDPAGFAREVEQALAAVDQHVDDGAEEGARARPADLLHRWREGRTALDAALRAAPAGTRLPWFGPPMSIASMATARLMETWAHGQDVADALSVRRAPTARLRHVARIGVRARDYAHFVHGLQPPREEFRVELTPPEGTALPGTVWAFGPPGAAQSVTGPAEDFCLLVTRRRNRADLALSARGADADRWLDIAQAFAGPPGRGRAPRQEPSGEQRADQREPAEQRADQRAERQATAGERG